MATDSSESRLLALPLELFNRISDNVDNETLLMLRLTCKAVEQATLSQFVLGNIAFRTFCIFHEARWILLKDILASRLAGRLRRVVFTTDALEYARPSQLAVVGENKELTIDTQNGLALMLRCSAGGCAQDELWPSSALVNRVLSDLEALAPKSCLEFDLLDVTTDGFVELPVHRAMIIAATMIELPLSALNLSHSSTGLFFDVLQYLGPRLKTCVASLRSFEYREPYGQDTYPWLDAIETILASASELRVLGLKSPTDIPRVYDLQSPAMTKVMHANSFSHLTDLHLEHSSYDENDIVAALSRCTTTLVSLSIKDINITTTAGAWLRVLQLLLSMPKLSFVVLSALWAGKYPQFYLVFPHAWPGATPHLTHFITREEVIGDLHKLLSKPFVFRDRTGAAV